MVFLCIFIFIIHICEVINPFMHYTKIHLEAFLNQLKLERHVLFTEKQTPPKPFPQTFSLCIF